MTKLVSQVIAELVNECVWGVGWFWMGVVHCGSHPHGSVAILTVVIATSPEDIWVSSIEKGHSSPLHSLPDQMAMEMSAEAKACLPVN